MVGTEVGVVPFSFSLFSIHRARGWAVPRSILTWLVARTGGDKGVDWHGVAWPGLVEVLPPGWLVLVE